MNRELLNSITIYVLFLHAIIEIFIIIIRFIFPELLPEFLGENPYSISYIKLMYSLTRIVVGIGIFKKKLWALLFGILISLTSIILAPIILPFGLIDLPLSLLVGFLITYIIIGDKELKIDEDVNYMKVD
jgi:hypothetical protein